MSEPTEPSLSDELNALGENLKQAMQALWESDERKRLQTDIEQGLEQALTAVRSEMTAFSESESGERLRNDLGSLQRELQNGQTASQLRQELAGALHTINSELRKAAGARDSTAGGPEREAE